MDKQAQIEWMVRNRSRGVHYLAAMTGMAVGTVRKELHLLTELKRNDGGWCVGDPWQPRSKRLALVAELKAVEVRKGARLKWNDGEEDGIARLLAGGTGADEIAEGLGRSVDAVLDRMSERGFPLDRVYRDWKMQEQKEGA